MKIYLLTIDADNRRKALGEQLDAMSVQVKLLTRSDCTVCCLSPSSQHFSASYCMLAHRTRVQAHLVGTWRKRLAGTPVIIMIITAFLVSCTGHAYMLMLVLALFAA